MMRKALAELKLWGLQRDFELSETTSQVRCCIFTLHGFQPVK